MTAGAAPVNGLQRPRPAYPTPADLTSVQQVFDSINAMTLQAMQLQMAALMNRQTMVAEGIEIGKLQAQVAEVTRQNMDLMKNIHSVAITPNLAKLI